VNVLGYHPHPENSGFKILSSCSTRKASGPAPFLVAKLFRVKRDFPVTSKRPLFFPSNVASPSSYPVVPVYAWTETSLFFFFATTYVSGKSGCFFLRAGRTASVTPFFLPPPVRNNGQVAKCFLSFSKTGTRPFLVSLRGICSAPFSGS